MADILIYNGLIVTMNQERQMIKDGAIVIDGNRIIDVGKTENIKRKYSFEHVIDAKKNPILPGFINTHDHLFQTLFKSLLDDMPLMEWLPSLYKMLPNIRKEDCYYAALIGCIELIKTGCTCVLDENYVYAGVTSDSVLQAFIEMGIRGTLARGHFDRDLWNLGTPFIEDTAVQIRDLESLIKKWKKHELVRVWSSPNWAPYCSDELITKLIEISKKHGTGISFHLNCEDEEVKRWKKATGYSPIQYYYNKGIPLLNPNLIAIHCVSLDEDDIKILRKTETNVSHNPVSNMYTGAGIAPIPKLIDAGVTVGLATDGAASNNCQDMLEVVKTTALLHKVANCDALAISAEKVLEMATIDGAKAIGLHNQIGSIEVGKKADIVIFDMKHANTAPTNRPHSQIVYCAKSHNVDTVIINGKIVMKNKKFATIDEPKIIEKTQNVINNLLHRSNVEAVRRGWVN